MLATVTLDISDVDRFVREGLARERPDLELQGYIVKSWRRELFQVVPGAAGQPCVVADDFRHAIDPQRAAL